MTLLFWNLPYPSIIYDYVTVCDVILALNPKSKNKKINKNENENVK